MKKIYLILNIWFFSSLITLSFDVFSQSENYIPLINPDNTWSTVADGSAGGMEPYSFYNRIDEVFEIINDKEYHKVYKTYDTIGLEDSWEQVGWIFEDLDNHQILFMDMDMDEGLIYDFSAAVGDELNVWNTMHDNISTQVVIVSIDSIMIGDEYRKRLFTETLEPPYNMEEQWIEGIGSSNGLLFSNYLLIGVNYDLLCFFENDELVYDNEDWEECFYDINTSIAESLLSDNINIWPNPAFNYITINENSILEVSLYNQTGQKALTIKSPNKTIDVSNLPPGLYFAEIKTGDGDVMRKIVVQ